MPKAYVFIAPSACAVRNRHEGAGMKRRRSSYESLQPILAGQHDLAGDQEQGGRQGDSEQRADDAE